MFGALDVAILGQGAGRLGQDEASQQDDDARTSCSDATIIKAPGQQICALISSKTEMRAPW